MDCRNIIIVMTNCYDVIELTITEEDLEVLLHKGNLIGNEDKEEMLEHIRLSMEENIQWKTKYM